MPERLVEIMKRIKTEEAVGHVLCHDIARIVIGKVKDTPFRRGQRLTEADIPLLLDLGKSHLFVMEAEDFDKLHEEDVAQALYDLCDSHNIEPSPVREGKIEAKARVDGLLKLDMARLDAINRIGELTIVTKRNHIRVRQGDVVAGMRCIPLLLEKEQVVKAQEIGEDTPLIEVMPFVLKKVGVVTTGSEVYYGRIQDAFTPIIKERIQPFGMEVVQHTLVPDDKILIVEAIREMLKAGVDLVFCTGGMSVDPDDLTPGAIVQCATEVVTHGLPVLPGSMFCIAYGENGVPLIGLPGGVLFSEPTAFDLLLPRLAAGDRITKDECLSLWHGGLLP